jgi:hypothetical protein
VNRPSKKREYDFWHSPYNLYMNALMEEVNEGWIMFLDDDDMLTDSGVITSLVGDGLNKDELTVFRCNFNGRSLPSDQTFGQGLALGDIGSCCFTFHSDHSWIAQWDEVKESDFRCVLKLGRVLGRISWRDVIVTQVTNNSNQNRGGFGTRNDIE